MDFNGIILIWNIFTALAIALLQSVVQGQTIVTVKIGDTANFTLNSPNNLGCTRNRQIINFSGRYGLVNNNDGTANMTLSQVTQDDYGWYTCMSNNDANTMIPFSLVVVEPIYMDVNQMVYNLNDNVTVTCRVTFYMTANLMLNPDQDLALSMMLNGKELVRDNRAYSMVTDVRKRNLTYSGGAIEDMRNNNITCLLKSMYFSESASQRVYIKTPPKEAKIANNSITTFYPGQTLVCTVDSYPLLTVNWNKLNVPCQSPPTPWSPNAGGMATLTLTPTCLGQQTWSCTATWTDMVTVVNDTITFTVLAIVLIQPTTPKPVNVTTLTAKLGSTVNLTLDGPALGVACTQNHISLVFDDRVQLIDLHDGTASLLISSVRGLDYGSYFCMWNNNASLIQQRFELYVVGPISMKVEQDGRQLGDNVTITCEVTYYWIPNYTLTPDYILSMTLGPLLLGLDDTSYWTTPHRKRTLMYSGKVIEEMIRTNVVCLLKRHSMFSMMKYNRISVFAPSRKANIANKAITPAKIYSPGQTLTCSADRDSLLAIGWEARNLINPDCPVSPSTSADLNAGIATLTTTHYCLGTQTWRCFAIWADLTSEEDVTIIVSNSSIKRCSQLFVLFGVFRVMTFSL